MDESICVDKRTSTHTGKAVYDVQCVTCDNHHPGRIPNNDFRPFDECAGCHRSALNWTSTGLPPCYSCKPAPDWSLSKLPLDCPCKCSITDYSPDLNNCSDVANFASSTVFVATREELHGIPNVHVLQEGLLHTCPGYAVHLSAAPSTWLPISSESLTLDGYFPQNSNLITDRRPHAKHPPSEDPSQDKRGSASIAQFSPPPSLDEAQLNLVDKSVERLLPDTERDYNTFTTSDSPATLPSSFSAQEESSSWQPLPSIQPGVANKNVLASTHDFQCELCPKVVRFSTTYQFRSHHQRHHTRALMPCSKCNKRLTQTNLDRHMRDVHGAKTLGCKNCGKLFSRKDNLKRHEARCSN